MKIKNVVEIVALHAIIIKRDLHVSDSARWAKDVAEKWAKLNPDIAEENVEDPQ